MKCDYCKEESWKEMCDCCAEADEAGVLKEYLAGTADCPACVRESERAMSYTLEQTRELAGATLQDSNGRYYRLFPDGDKGIPTYGYRTHLTDTYVCYTCGHLCECEGEGESDDVDTVSWSSSNPTGEVRQDYCKACGQVEWLCICEREGE